MIDQQKDGTTRPDGRQERRKKKKRESRDTELEKLNKHFYVQLVGKDDTRDPREGRDGGAKMTTMIIKERNKYH